MPQVQLPDGSIAEFPEGMSQEQMATVIRGYLGGQTAPQQPAEPDWRAALAQALVPKQTGLTADTLRAGLAGGILRGARDPIDQGAALLAKGLQAVAPEGLQPFAQQQLKSVADVNRAAEEDYTKNWRQGSPPDFDVGRLIGNIAVTAPLAAQVPGAAAAGLMPRMLAGGVGGAASGALQPVSPDKPSFWDDVGQNALTGGIFGSLAPAVFGGVARMIRPNTSPAVESLMREGVNPTPGQVLGGAVNRAEQGLTSIPGLGDVIRNARRDTVVEFDRGAINRVLGRVGEQLESPGMDRAAIREMQTKVSNAYDAAVPSAGARFDQQAVNDFAALRRSAQMLPPDKAKQFDEVLKQYVFDRLSPNGSLTGQSFKEAESDLGKKASGYLGNPNSDSDTRALGNAIREAQSTLRTWLARANPASADDIQSANAAWAEMLRVRNASGRAGAEPGVFSPAALQAAAKKYSSESQFTGGRALMGDYADAGRAVLGATVPDSGTPYRALLNVGTLAGLGGATAAGAPFSLLALAGYGATTGLGALLYSPTGRAVLARLFASRPASATGVANVVRDAGSVAPAAVPALGWF